MDFDDKLSAPIQVSALELLWLIDDPLNEDQPTTEALERQMMLPFNAAKA